LLSQQQPDGRWERENNDGTGSTLDELYDTAIAGRALVEGYREFGNSAYLSAAEDAANWHLNATIEGIYSESGSPHRYGPPLEAAANFDNANYVALAAWHLASLYKVTGSTQYLEGARSTSHYIMACQDPSDGTWEHYDGDTDKLMRYHSITLRGLLETYHAIKGDPAYSALQDSLETSITSAINYMIEQQNAAPDPDKKLIEENGTTDTWVSGLEVLSMAHEYLDMSPDDRGKLESLIFALARSIRDYDHFSGLSYLLPMSEPWVRHEDIKNYAQYLHSTVSGTVYPGMVWEGTIRITGDVTVPEGVTLTISPGTTVIFSAGSDDQHSGLYPDKCELAVYGTLNADGVAFRSSNTTNPTNSDWEGITIKSGGSAKLPVDVIMHKDIIGRLM